MTGSVRCCTVEVCDTDRDRLSAAFEVRANRSTEGTELILGCRFYADNRVCTEHVRTDVESSTGAIRRNEVSVCLNKLCDSLNEALLWELRHLKSCCGVHHTFCV